jgi:glycosyltransferase involved in cell wall biosynthesis
MPSGVGPPDTGGDLPKTELTAAATGGERGRWVIVAEEPFLPANSGGRIETLSFLQACRSARVARFVLVPGLDDVDYGVHQRELAPAIVRRLPRRTRSTQHLSTKPYVVASRPFPSGLSNVICAEVAGWGATGVISSSFRVAHIGVALARSLGLPLVIRPHNIESEYFASLAGTTSGLRKLAYRVESEKLRRYERIVHQLDEVTAFADISQEEAVQRGRLSRRPVHFLPPFLPKARPSSPQARSPAGEVLYLGAFDNPNNVTGLRWLLKQVWPRVLAQRPSAMLRVVGRRPTSEVVEAIAGSPRTVRSTDLPDVTPAFESASVFVNPTQRGAGVNIKVVEAANRGVPIVSTSVGLRGLALKPGIHALVADSPEQFASAVVRLLAEPMLGKQLATTAQMHIRTVLGHDRLMEALLAMFAPPARW